MKLGIPKKYMRDPMNSEITCLRLEPALGCYGEECGLAVPLDAEGTLELLPPHCHLVSTGSNPEACERAYAVDGQVPPDVFEVSHR